MQVENIIEDHNFSTAQARFSVSQWDFSKQGAPPTAIADPWEPKDFEQVLAKKLPTLTKLLSCT